MCNHLSSAETLMLQKLNCKWWWICIPAWNAIYFTSYTTEWVSYPWLFLGFFQPGNKRESGIVAGTGPRGAPEGRGTSSPGPATAASPRQGRAAAPSAGPAATAGRQNSSVYPSRESAASREPAGTKGASCSLAGSSLPSVRMEIAHGALELRPSRKLTLQKGLQKCHSGQ